MTEHTKGPWHIGKPNIAKLDGFRVHRIPISAGGVAIASVWCGSVGKEYFASDGPANADLIGAAPETAAAARAMLAALDGLLEPCTADLTPADWQRAIDAKAQAEAAGIKGE